MQDSAPLNVIKYSMNPHVDFESLQTGSVAGAKRCGSRAHPGTRLRQTHRDMLRRCYDLCNKGYTNYGGRGIRVCDRWRESFDNFYADMGDRPDGFTLERIDVNGNYEPSNCRWASWEEQHNNRRNNTLLTYKGETTTVARWCKRLGLTRGQVVKLISPIAPDHKLSPREYLCGCVVYLPASAGNGVTCPAHFQQVAS